MSIASPRPSISVRSASSTRTSLDSSSRPPPTVRRNRAALREFYGLKHAPRDEAKISEESARTELGLDDHDHDDDNNNETLAELDAAAFDADTFVHTLLASEGLHGVLRVEADLISQIRTLDSDRKSLVYDNYSKLLSATSTIRRMRGNMDPLAPTTHTLGPAISHIAETAAALSSSMQASAARSDALGISIRIQSHTHDDVAHEAPKQAQRETVRWVLGAPQRLRALQDQEQRDEAEVEWQQVVKLLDQWEGVAGVRELRDQCEGIMQAEDESD